MKREYYIIGIALLLLIVSFFLGSLHGKRKALSGFSSSTDTLYITKTISGSTASVLSSSLLEWKEIRVPAVCSVKDTIEVPRVIVEKDTFRVYVPITQTKFSIADGKVRIWASGYNVGIDKWEYDEVTREVKVYPKQHRVFASADGGLYGKNPHLAVMANYGYSTRWGMEVSAGLGYDILSNGIAVGASVKMNIFAW